MATKAKHIAIANGSARPSCDQRAWATINGRHTARIGKSRRGCRRPRHVARTMESCGITVSAFSVKGSHTKRGQAAFGLANGRQSVPNGRGSIYKARLHQQ